MLASSSISTAVLFFLQVTKQSCNFRREWTRSGVGGNVVSKETGVMRLLCPFVCRAPRARATLSMVVPAYRPVCSQPGLGRPVPTRLAPSASRIRATRRRAPPIGRALPLDPGRARAARSFPRTPPHAHNAPPHRDVAPRILASLRTKSFSALPVPCAPCRLGMKLARIPAAVPALCIDFVRAIYWIIWILT